MGIPPQSEHRPLDGTGEAARPDEHAGQESPGRTHAAKAVASLVLAIVAPASLILTAPFASFAMLLTFPYSGPSKNPWLAPLVFWILPLIFGITSASLGGSALRKSGLRGQGSGLALAAMCINSVIFIVGLLMTLRFVYMMR
jgi:hypothetical protein